MQVKWCTQAQNPTIGDIELKEMTIHFQSVLVDWTFQ